MLLSIANLRVFEAESLSLLPKRIPWGARDAIPWMIEHSMNGRAQWQPTTAMIAIGHTFEYLFCSIFVICFSFHPIFGFLHRPEFFFDYFQMRRMNSEIDCEVIWSDKFFFSGFMRQLIRKLLVICTINADFLPTIDVFIHLIDTFLFDASW